jgi:hypothetical protein
MANDEYPDSRDPDPPHRALRRIAREAREIQERLERGTHVHRLDQAAAMARLAGLIAELANILATIEER